MSKEDGGPAFPAHDYIVGDLQKDGFQKLGNTRGMTLRDYLAAMAMQGMLANSYSGGPCDPLSQANRHEIARLSFSQSDAMLAERNK